MDSDPPLCPLVVYNRILLATPTPLTCCIQKYHVSPKIFAGGAISYTFTYHSHLFVVYSRIHLATTLLMVKYTWY